MKRQPSLPRRLFRRGWQSLLLTLVVSIPLVYLIRSADMYGTERMALATLEGLAADFQVILLGPLGPAIFEAQKLGFEAHSFQSTPQLIKTFIQILRKHDHSQHSMQRVARRLRPYSKRDQLCR